MTTALVIAEGHGWFLRRFDSGRALQFIQFIEALRPVVVAAVDPALLAASYRLLRKFADRNLTLVDACGLALMARERIRHCWSTDRHMSLGGAQLAVR